MDTPSSAPSTPSDPSPAGAVIVLTTWPADREPEAFARQLVEERLAACVNLLPPMISVYRWQGEVQQEPERQLMMKTERRRVRALIARVQELHPYDVPECLVLPVEDGGAAYLAWIAESVAAR